MASKNGRYYFYFCADARIGVAVADSPAGPFTDVLGTPLIAANPDGGQAIDPAVFTDDDGQRYIAYHRFAIPGGDGTHREVTIDRLRFNPDGTIASVSPTLESIPPA